MILKISQNKFKTCFVMIGVLLIQIIATSVTLNNSVQLNDENKLIIISWVCLISFIMEIYLWYKMVGDFLSPYVVFFLVMFLFTCGQSIGWALGIDMGDKDLWNRVDHGLTHALVLQGLCYSIISITVFHFGAILTFDPLKVNSKYSKWSEKEVLACYKTVGKLFIIVCIPAFFAKVFQDMNAVTAGGYSAYYAVNSSRSTLMSFVSILAEYYQPCMLLLLIAYRDSKNKRKLIIFAMLIDVLISLYIGGRSGAIMTLLGILLAYHYFIKPFKRKTALLSISGGYIGMAVMNSMASVRKLSNKDISDFIVILTNSFSNVIGDFIGELGWTLTSICWTMNIVPKNYNFRYGMSYLVSFVSWVPSFFFGGVAHNPVVIWANLSDWLTDALQLSYGPGYTIVAESYINFGWIGLIAMSIEGAIVAKLISDISRINVKNNTLKATFQIMIIMIIMKSLVRSSLSVAVRSTVFTLLPMYILVYLTLKRRRSNERN